MITQMPFALNRVVNLEDFQEHVVGDAIRGIYARESGDSPEFPRAREHRKQWEVAMAALALEDGAVLDLMPKFSVSALAASRPILADELRSPGVGHGPIRHSRPPGRRCATDDAHESWERLDGPWNHRRLVVQHMDACELLTKTRRLTASSRRGRSSISARSERIGLAMDEACRVLKRGGTASFSTEFLIGGDPLAFESRPYVHPRSDRERSRRAPRLDPRQADRISALPRRRLRPRSAFRVPAREQRGQSIYPHCALRVGPNLITSVHFALRKSVRPHRRRLVSLRDRSAPASA